MFPGKINNTTYLPPQQNLEINKRKPETLSEIALNPVRKNKYLRSTSCQTTVRLVGSEN